MTDSIDILNQIVIRVAHKSDQAYVAKTWLKSYSSARYDIKRDKIPYAFTRELGNQIDSIMDDPLARCLIATDLQKDHKFIVGWLVYAVIAKPKTQIIPYIYIRNDYRQLGVAGKLIKQAGISTTSPIIYLFDGPDIDLLKTKANLVKMNPEDLFKQDLSQ